MTARQTPCDDTPEESSVQQLQCPSYYDRETREWKELKPGASQEAEPGNDVMGTLESFRSILLASLQMRNLVVFAGSGTSLGQAGGPSMSDLWNSCLRCDSNSGQASDLAQEVLGNVRYDLETEGNNIETLLSRCDAYQQLRPSDAIREFVRQAKQVILKECSEFLSGASHEQLEAHSTFLRRVARRRARDPRLKLFTTNYDLCFETAAARLALVPITGFSFTEPRHFDPRYFAFDIVRNSAIENDVSTPLEGVFHHYKLHGSVNWERAAGDHIEMTSDPSPDRAVLIYPAEGKYQQSFIQPHLEIMSRYLAALREPNTCVIIVGFGFNDSHLSEPVLSAIRTNPFLRVIVVNPRARENATHRGENPHIVWRDLMSCATVGDDVWLVDATFSQFARLIPDLRVLSAGERLRRNIVAISRGRDGS